MFISILALIISIISLIIMIRMSNSIIKPIEIASDIAEKIAKGDINIEFNYDSKDEMGKLLQSMKKMSGVIHNLVTGINTLANVGLK